VPLAELRAGDGAAAPRPDVPGPAVRAAALLGTAVVTAGVPALIVRRLLRGGRGGTT
jgi:hypothetical protein